MDQVLVQGSTSLLNYGVLGFLVLVLGFVVTYLFKVYIADNKARITALETTTAAHEKKIEELREHDAKREAASTAAIERNTEVMSGVMEVLTGLRLDLAKHL